MKEGSIMTNYEKIRFYLKAQTPCLWITTYEEGRVLDVLKNYCFTENAIAQVWSLTSGLKKMRIKDSDRELDANLQLSNPDTLFTAIAADVPQQETLWILKDLNKCFTQLPYLYRQIRDLKECGSKYAYSPIIIISIDKHVPKELDKLCTVIDFDILTKDEVEKIVLDMSMVAASKYPNVHKTDVNTNKIVANILSGLTFVEIINILKRSVSNYQTFDINLIMEEKVKLIQKTDVLDYKVPKLKIEHIGGNENFKNWINSLEAAMHPEARSFGCAQPKGYLSLGIPGSGKTTFAEAIAEKLKIPYIKFNISRIMSKMVGESEKNIEEAIRLVKASAPCVFLIDEIEKVLGGGVQSSNATDGGTTSRVLASLLTFLQESDNGVLTVMTSNDISQLPPELTRAERLDAIWYFGLPTLQEREDIFNIHLNKTGKKYDQKIITRVAKECERFTGAEIESLVKKSVWYAFLRYKEGGKDEIIIDDLLEAKQLIIPIADSSKEKIAYLENWAKTRALSASAKKTSVAKQKALSEYENMLSMN